MPSKKSLIPLEPSQESHSDTTLGSRPKTAVIGHDENITPTRLPLNSSSTSVDKQSKAFPPKSMIDSSTQPVNTSPSATQVKLERSEPGLGVRPMLSSHLQRCSGLNMRIEPCTHKQKKPIAGAHLVWFCEDHKTKAPDWHPDPPPNPDIKPPKTPTSTLPVDVPALCGEFTRKMGRCKNNRAVCHYHKTLGLLVYHLCNLGELKYSDWIPDNLRPETQEALRRNMIENPSELDGPGYIYAFEIKDPKESNVPVKVGLEKVPGKRTRDWGKHYHSLPVRPIFGGLNKRDKAVKLPFCHRVEKLCHIELQDRQVKDKCMVPGCTTRHQEIFSFHEPLVDEVVINLIKKWTKFSNMFYAATKIVS